MVLTAILTLGNCAIFRPKRCVLQLGCNMPTKLGDDWSNSIELATTINNYSKLNMVAAAILNIDQCAIFRRNRCVLHLIRNIPTKIDKDWFNSEEIVNVFQNPKWRQSLSWLLVTVLFVGILSRYISDLQHSHQIW